MNSRLRVSIRPARSEDCSTVYAFMCDLEETELDKGHFRGIFERNLTRSAVWYRIAEYGGQVVGFVSCHMQELLHHAGRVGEIQELYVSPAYRSQQVGRQLITHLEAIAREHNFATLEVATNQRRTDAIRFYERAGFVASHRKLVKPF